MLLLYRFVSGWPLGLLHGVGAALGWLSWLLSPTYRRRFAQNAAQAGYAFGQVRAAVAHAGRMACETPRLWFDRVRAKFPKKRLILYKDFLVLTMQRIWNKNSI